MIDSSKNWYVIRAVSGSEKKVKQYIENEVARLHLEDYVSQILVPTEKIYQIRKGKKISKEKNYFPGYVIIEAILTGEIVHTIKSLPGVLGFLGTRGGDPTPIRATEIRKILGKMDELLDKDQEINETFIVGETGKVIEGPFNSFSGVIEEVNEERKKLKVMVKIFGRKTPLELGFLQVEKE